jgi:phage shock protein PspC (stress-responsive transcriptional regulator)
MGAMVKATYIVHMDELNDEPKVEAEDSTAKTRILQRSTTKKVFGGVASGVAERFDVDANIVRVAFVVLALVYGLGIAIYLAMWALIPRSSDANSGVVSDDLMEHDRRHWLRYAVPLSVVALAVIVLSTLGNAHPGIGKGLSLVWLIFLVLVAVIAFRSPASRLTLRRMIALAFLSAVSLVILVVGAFLVTLQVIGVPLEGGSGVHVWHPISTSEIQRTYHGAFGQSTINLVDVPFTSGTWSITATQGVGTLIIDIPANAVVDLRTHVGIGNVQSETVPSANAAVRGARPRLVLNLEVGIGQIQLLRFQR